VVILASEDVATRSARLATGGLGRAVRARMIGLPEAQTPTLSQTVGLPRTRLPRVNPQRRPRFGFGRKDVR